MLRTKIEAMILNCAKDKQEAVLEAISRLSDAEQSTVEAWLSAVNYKSNNDRQYKTQWIYECLLLRMKSKKAYIHVRRHKALALVVKGTYGFQCNILEALKTTTSNMSPQDIRCTRGDHALVLFKGKWVQTSECFLSKGVAIGTIVHKIIIECVILPEKAGLRINAITTDGASRNRSMWNTFGVTDKNVAIDDIVDYTHRHWFFSDFPYLIECIRNFFTYQQKYNQAWFFGIVDVLQLFKNSYKDLKDCEGNIRFC
ncbi:uncharacterized protein [Neodiprion pinetum]|uniref:uncharacterized protein n=1 Tax=Neodiprion pinetum TaxID=441929 RepID=UPI0037113F8B